MRGVASPYGCQSIFVGLPMTAIAHTTLLCKMTTVQKEACICNQSTLLACSILNFHSFRNQATEPCEQNKLRSRAEKAPTQVESNRLPTSSSWQRLALPELPREVDR